MTAHRRRGSGSIAALLLLGLTAIVPAAADDNLRCGSRIVSVAAITAAVRAVCGEPAYVDRFDDAYPDEHRYVADSEVWTYDFGPHQLLRLLRFRNGRLVSVDTDGYGFAAGAAPGCQEGDLVEGISKYRLLRTCGEPVAQRARRAFRTLRPRLAPQRPYDGFTGSDYVTPVFREDWTYNFGGRGHLRTAVLENGWVVDVFDEGRGYDPP